VCIEQQELQITVPMLISCLLVAVSLLLLVTFACEDILSSKAKEMSSSLAGHQLSI